MARKEINTYIVEVTDRNIKKEISFAVIKNPNQTDEYVVGKELRKYRTAYDLTTKFDFQIINKKFDSYAV